MSNLKKSDDFLKDGVISEQAMIAYLNNTLSPEEKQQFEKLLAEDPFAQDALEGLQAAQNKAAVSASIANVRTKVRERSGMQEKKMISIHWTNYAWAAAVFGLLIGIGFLMVNYMGKTTNTGIAENKPAASETEASKQLFEQKATETQIQPEGGVIGTDSAITNITQGTYTVTVSDANGTTAPEAEKALKDREDLAVSPQGQQGFVANKSKVPVQDTSRFLFSPPVMNSTITANNSGGTSPAAPANGTTTYAWTTDKTVTAAEESKNAERVVTTGTKMEADAGLKKNFKAKVPDYKEEAKKADDLDEAAGTGRNEGEVTIDDAMTSFNKGDYKKSAEQFDAVLKKQPENPDALYFGGISDYINGKNAKSEKSFDKLLKDGKRYLDGSKWYKANILLKKGKTEEAKKLLQELANSNGSYKERAVKKIEEVK